jgi:hypothetical protein
MVPFWAICILIHVEIENNDDLGINQSVWQVTDTGFPY